jgi:erythromycin esterase-like protein
MKVCCLLAALLLAVSCTPPTTTPPSTDDVASIHELPSAPSLNPTHLDPIRTAVGGKTIVMMGEAIHFTSEISRTRDVLVRNLHEGGNFNLLLFEGSPIDFWIAEEEYFSSKKDVLSSSDFQKNALLGFWQNDEIRSVIDYALRSQSGEGISDLYLSSYDVQIGQGRRFARGRSVFETLISLLRKRDKRISAADADAILFLEGLVSCERKGFPDSDEDYSKAEMGIDALSRVVARTVKTATSDLHEKTLTLLPKMAGYSLEFCRAAQDSSRDSAEVRDDWSSQQFKDLFSSLNQKAMVWAHSAYIRQSADRDGRMSFGGYLRSAFPDEIFAIHFTGADGRAIAFTDAKGVEIQPIETTLLPIEKVSLEAKLARLSATDFFITSEKLPLEIGKREATRREPGGSMAVDPRKDFDGYYFIREISPPVSQ